MSDKPKFAVYENNEGVEQFLGYVDNIKLPVPEDKTVVIDSVPDHLFPHQRKAMEFLLNNDRAFVTRVLPDGADTSNAGAWDPKDADEKERGITLWSPKTVTLGLAPQVGKTLAILAARSIAASAMPMWDEEHFPDTGSWSSIEARLLAKEIEQLNGATNFDQALPGFHVQELVKSGHGLFPSAGVRSGECIPGAKPVKHDKLRARAKSAKAARKRNRRK